MTKQVWFVRHGESVANAGGASSETANIPLTAKGHDQARRVAQLLPCKPSLIVISPYIRTHETARPTQERWPDVPHEVWPVHEFTYLSCQKLGLTTYEQRRHLVVDYWSRKDPDYLHGEDAETFRDLMGRVDHAIDKIAEADHEKIVIFSHGQFMGALFFRLAHPDHDPLDMTKIRSHSEALSIRNTAIAHFSFYGDGRSEMHGLETGHVE